ncbi:hypothetical protein MCSF7_01911 [Mycoplasmopsis columbina SF7]|uniref:Uncharacterized protein n=1 Tax=Mycoplasmopsis columbina SF7 TaxID=1037410 RepID=F9UKG9_9BACT|nr:hypothetical protein [Mycoplasmopsis columbina]EGV00174.1 hypothetical protein MCSF7_01911 [Mycoplasmopsis columbina SF7]
MTKKNKTILTLSLLSVGAITGIGVLTALNVATFKNSNQSTDELKKYNFLATDKLDKNVLPSTYAYASYSIPVSANDIDPNLKYSNNEQREYWAYQLELNSGATSPVYASKNRNPLFTLKTKDNEPIDLLKEKYNIYYQSFANDKEGILYLKVSLEDKNNEELLKKSISERRATWEAYTYKMDGFAKLTNEEAEKKHNLSLWNFAASNKLNLDVSNNKINSIQDLLNLLPQKTNDEKSEQDIKNMHSKVKEYFSFASGDRSINPYYKIDTSREIWFSDTIDDNQLTINYHILKVVPVASDKEDSSLDAITTIPVGAESQKITINIDQLKEAANKIQIISFNNTDLSKKNPIDPNFVYFTNIQNNSSHHNTSEGYYDALDLIFDPEFKDANKYVLKYYKYDSQTGFIKNKFKDLPLVSYDENTGTASFAVSISLKNASDQNGILTLIKVITLENTFQKNETDSPNEDEGNVNSTSGEDNSSNSTTN